MKINQEQTTGLEIAVIGMAGRFPGAHNIDRYWENLKNGVESITFFTDEELEAAGVRTRHLENPNYVKANSILEGIEYFDAGFFGYTPAEAQVLAPQVRLFHEITWEAMENAGYNPETYDGLVGLYAGASDNLYWQAKTIMTGAGRDGFSLKLLSSKDLLSTRISYKMNLKGPSTTIYTACSTSLVAVHTACRSLLSGECDMALAGGVSLVMPQQSGYMYSEGMIFSSDGHTRSFDAKADGFVFGSALGIVVLNSL
ncbi:MAG: polyketide synthase [bacterium]|nr:polyketide synthase [bacterium]